MAGHTISKLRILDQRDHPASFEHEARRLHIDFGPFASGARSNVVLIAGGAAFMVGVVLWGFLALSIMAGVDSLLGETESRQTLTETSEAQVFDCTDFGAVRALSAENEARLQAQCGALLPVSAPVEVVSAAPGTSAVATSTNRANCDQVRGTDYLSAEERTWYLANCVTQ
jgi:hypothetical protein